MRLKLLSHVEGRTKSEGGRGQDAEENIGTEDGKKCIMKSFQIFTPRHMLIGPPNQEDEMDGVCNTLVRGQKSI
jgi:hypothetical protein